MKVSKFRATHRPIIRSLKLHWQPLVFHTWKVVGRVVGGRGQCPPTTRPATFHVWKTRGCQCSFRLLMMGGVSPETCWVSYKYRIIKFWYIVASCWIFSLRIVPWCTDLRTSRNRGSVPGRWQLPDRHCGRTSLGKVEAAEEWYRTTHLQLEPRLKISGTLTLFPLYACRSCTGTTFIPSAFGVYSVWSAIGSMFV